MKKITFLFTGNFELSGQMFHFKKGQDVLVSEEDAERLITGLNATEFPAKIDETKGYYGKLPPFDPVKEITVKPKKAVVNDNKNHK